jgi:cell shape-determining protein MreC
MDNTDNTDNTDNIINEISNKLQLTLKDTLKPFFNEFSINNNLLQNISNILKELPDYKNLLKENEELKNENIFLSNKLNNLKIWKLNRLHIIPLLKLN